jgi:hypothetical protein
MLGDTRGSGRLPTPREVATEVEALLRSEHRNLGVTVSVEWAPPVEGGYYVRLHLGEDSELVGGGPLGDVLEEWGTSGTGLLRVLVEGAAAALVLRARSESEGDES